MIEDWPVLLSVWLLVSILVSVLMKDVHADYNGNRTWNGIDPRAKGENGLTAVVAIVLLIVVWPLVVAYYALKAAVPPFVSWLLSTP